MADPVVPAGRTPPSPGGRQGCCGRVMGFRRRPPPAGRQRLPPGNRRGDPRQPKRLWKGHAWTRRRVRRCDVTRRAAGHPAPSTWATARQRTLLSGCTHGLTPIVSGTIRWRTTHSVPACRGDRTGAGPSAAAVALRPLAGGGTLAACARRGRRGPRLNGRTPHDRTRFTTRPPGIRGVPAGPQACDSFPASSSPSRSDVSADTSSCSDPASMRVAATMHRVISGACR